MIIKKNSYWIEVNAEDMCIRNLINPSFLKKYCLEEVKKIEITHVYNGGMNIFIYTGENECERWGIDTLDNDLIEKLKATLVKFNIKIVD